MEILIEDYAPDAILLTGLDDAIVGIVESFGGGSRILYDKRKIIKILMERDGMSRGEAEEFYDYNILGGYFGDLGPVFLEVNVKSVLDSKKGKIYQCNTSA